MRKFVVFWVQHKQIKFGFSEGIEAKKQRAGVENCYSRTRHVPRHCTKTMSMEDIFSEFELEASLWAEMHCRYF